MTKELVVLLMVGIWGITVLALLAYQVWERRPPRRRRHLRLVKQESRISRNKRFFG